MCCLLGQPSRWGTVATEQQAIINSQKPQDLECHFHSSCSECFKRSVFVIGIWSLKGVKKLRYLLLTAFGYCVISKICFIRSINENYLFIYLFLVQYQMCILISSSPQKCPISLLLDEAWMKILLIRVQKLLQHYDIPKRSEQFLQGFFISLHIQMKNFKMCFVFSM